MTNDELKIALSRADFHSRRDCELGFDEPCASCGSHTAPYYHLLHGNVFCDYYDCVKAVVGDMLKDYQTAGCFDSWEQYLDEGVRS